MFNIQLSINAINLIRVKQNLNRAKNSFKSKTSNSMKLARILLFYFVIIIAAPSCATKSKALEERRNLMMPHTSDISKNSKYKAPKKKKTYKPANSKKMKKR